MIIWQWENEAEASYGDNKGCLCASTLDLCLQTKKENRKKKRN
jgi:hypothetical protein